MRFPSWLGCFPDHTNLNDAGIPRGLEKMAGRGAMKRTEKFATTNDWKIAFERRHPFLDRKIKKMPPTRGPAA
jgi:hypothetical protein